MLAFTVLATALLASLVSAQSFSSLPQCAQNCTINAIPNSCNLDPKCICSDAGFIKAITCCVANVCDKADQEATLKYADSICVPAGVTNLPTAASCASGQKTSTPAGAAGATGSAATSASSAISSVSSAASSAMASASSAASSANSVASMSATSASAAAVASSTGDANQAFYVQGLGMVGAAVGAAVALM